MPVITTYDPLSAASDAVGTYTTAKRQAALEDAAAQQAQRSSDLEAQRIASETAASAAQTDATKARTKLDADRFAYDQTRDTAQDALAAKAADRADRAEAARALHEAAADARAAAREKNAERKNDREYALQVAKVNAQLKLETAKLAQAKSAEQLRAATSVAVANIHASTELEATGMREQGENARASAREAGEDRRHADTERHADVRAARAGARGAGEDVTGDLGALSPVAQQFLDSVQQGQGENATPATRAQAIMALAGVKKRGGSGMTAGDFGHLEKILGAKSTEFVSPTHQQSVAISAGTRADRATQATDKLANAAVMRSKTVRALPPQDQANLEQLLGRFGTGTKATLDAIVQGGVPAGGLDPASAARMSRALGQ